MSNVQDTIKRIRALRGDTGVINSTPGYSSDRQGATITRIRALRSTPSPTQTVTPTVTAPDLTPAPEVKDHGTLGEFAKATVGSLGKGIVNLIRSTASTLEENFKSSNDQQDKMMQDLLMKQKRQLSPEYQEKTALEKIKSDWDSTVEQTAQNWENEKQKDGFMPLRALKNENNVAVNTLKPVEESLAKWADVENESWPVRIASGALESLPQTIVTMVNPIVGVPLLFNNSFQNNMEQYKAQGLNINDKKVVSRAFASATLDSATEYMFSAFKGFKAMGGALDGAKGVKGTILSGAKGFLDGFIAESEQTFIKPTVKNFVKFLVKQGTEEGLEEVASGLGSGLIAKMTTSPDLQWLSWNEDAVVSGQQLVDSFSSGFLMGSVLAGVNNTQHFSNTRKIMKEVVGDKSLSEVTEDDVKQVLGTLREDMKSPEAQRELAEKLAKGTAKAEAIINNGSTVKNNTTGETLTMTFTDGKDEIILSGPSGSTSVTHEEFDNMFEQQILTKATPAPQAVNNSDLPVQPAAGVAPQVAVSEKISAGKPRRDSSTKYLAKNGKKQAINSYMAGKDAIVEITVPGTSVPVQIKLNPETFANAENKAMYIQEATQQARGLGVVGIARKHVDPQDYGQFYRVVAQAAESTVSHYMANGDYKSIDEVKAEEAQNTAKSIEEAKTKKDEQIKAMAQEVVKAEQEEASTKADEESITKEVTGKKSDDLTAEQVTKIDKLRKIVRNVQERSVNAGHMKQSILDALLAVDKDMKTNGIEGYITPVSDKQVTKRMRKIKEFAEKTSSKKIIFVNTVGDDRVNGFVNDFEKDTVFVSITGRSDVDITWAIGHELYHLISKDGNGDILAKAVESVVTDEQVNEYLKRYDSMPELKDYLKTSGKVMEEMVADKAGDVFASSKFWKALADSMPEDKQSKKLNEIANYLEKAKKAVSQQDPIIPAIDAMIEAFNKRSSVKQNADSNSIDYSINKSYNGDNGGNPNERDDIQRRGDQRGLTNSDRSSQGKGNSSSHPGRDDRGTGKSTSGGLLLNRINDSSVFYERIKEAIKNNPFGSSVEVKSLDDYSSKDIMLFLSQSEGSGFAVSNDGNIVSVFKNPQSNEKNSMYYIMLTALQNRGNRLDCFAGFLPRAYADFGMVPVARLKWNDEYAPENWNYERDKRPDIVFMAHNGDSVDTVVKKYKDYPEYDLKTVPYVKDYDEGLKAQKEYLEKAEKKKSGGVLYSINPEFEHDYDVWDKSDPRVKFVIGTTSNALRSIGVHQQSIGWDSSKIIKIKSEHPSMTDEIIKQVPDIIENPIMIMESRQNRQAENRITLFGEVFDKNNVPVLAVLELEPTDRNGYDLNLIKVISAYEKDSNPQLFINRSKMLYINPDKKRTNDWLRRTRLQLPVGLNSYGSIARVSYARSNVNNQLNSKFSVKGVDPETGEEGYIDAHNFNRAFTEDNLNKNTLEVITAIHRFYRVKPNNETIKEVAALLDSKNKRAAARIVAADPEKMSAKYTVMRMFFMYEADQRGESGVAADWAYVLNKSGKEAGQTIQAYAIFNKLSPGARVMYAEREILGDVSDDNLKRIRNDGNAIKKELNNIDKEGSIQVLSDLENLLKNIRRSEDRVQRKIKALEQLEARIKKYMSDTEDYDTDAIKEFVDALHGIAAVTLPVSLLPNTSNPLVFMRWAINNMDSMKNAMSETYKMIKRVKGHDSIFMAEIDAYLGEFIPELEGSISGQMDDATKQNIKSILTTKMDGYLTFNAMVKRLIELGVDTTNAVLVAREARNQIDELTKKQKIRSVEKILNQPDTKSTRKTISQIVNVMNENDMADPTIQAYIAKTMGLPNLSPALQREIYDLGKQITEINQIAASDGRALNKEEERHTAILMATMLAAIQRQKPVGISKKIDLIQSMMMMSMFKSAERNIIGNTGFLIIDTGKDYVAAGIDMVMSKLTGNPRTVALPELGAMIHGAIEGGKNAFYDITHGIDTSEIDSQYGMHGEQVLKSKLGKLMMMVFKLKMTLPDRIYQGAVYQSALEGIMKMKGETTASQDTIEAAQYEAQYKTFADDNKASEFFSAFRKIFNLNIGKQYNSPNQISFGIGSAIIKFPKVPGALLMRTIEYSPISLFRALYQIVRPIWSMKKSIGPNKTYLDRFDQKKFAKTLANGTYGSITSIGVGLLLSALGLMTGRLPEDQKEKDMLATMGVTRGYQLNISGLWRFVISGFNIDEATMREGDTLTTYSWMAPMAIGMAVGANMVNDTKNVPESDSDKVTDVLNKTISAFSGGLDSLTEMTVLSGLKDFIDNFKFSGLSLETLIKTMADVPASFVPQQAKIMRDMLDNTARTTYSNDNLEYAYRLVLNRLPGASMTLPESRDVFGNLKEVYQDNGNNVWNVFFNPAYVTKYTPNEAAILVLDVMAAKEGTSLEATNVTPSKVTRYLTYTDKSGLKQKINLTDYEVSDLQQKVGNKVEELFKKIPADMMASDKIKTMNKIISEVAYAYKQKLLAEKLAKK